MNKENNNSTGSGVSEEDFLADLYLFYRYFIASNYRDSVPAPHIKKLAVKLMELALHGDNKHRLAVSMPPRHPISKDCPVHTVNRGWIKHGDLKVGDYVISPTGKSVEVLKVLPTVMVDNCFEFSNGDRIICGDEHLWKFHDYNNNITRLFTAREVMNRELYVGNSYLSNFKIPSHNKYISLIDKYKVPSVEGNCITIDSKDGLYLVGENNTPTHNSKSSMVTLAFPLWLLFQDPNVNIMIVTGSPKLAEKFGIQLREYVRELGQYFNVYLSNVKQASTHIMFCDRDGKLYRGNIMLASSGGGITGQDADYLILDDPYTGNDSEFTPSAKKKKIDWVNRVVEQRIEPHTKYCVLHTRWHSQDIIGYYMDKEPDLYDFVVFPAIDEDTGEVLWKERYTKEEILKKKEIVGDRVFESVYQQKPIDTTSDFFNMQTLKFGVPENYTPQASVRAWDIASSDALSNNDFSAGVKMVRYDDYAVITDLVHGRFGGQINNIIKNTAFNDTPNTHIYIETGVAGAGELLYQEWKKQLKGYIVKRAKLAGRGNKADRATPLKNAIEDGKVYVNIEDESLRQVLLDELTGFPNMAHDDIVDAIAHSFNYLFMNDAMGRKVNARMGVIKLW